MKKIVQYIMIVAVLFMAVSEINAMGAGSEKANKDSAKVTAAPVRNHQQMVREVLDNLIAAYSTRNTAGFLSYVTDDFAGDKTMLDRAVRKDFSTFTNIDIRYTFNNVTADSTGNLIYASVTFTRSHTVIKTGRQSEIKGATDFVFKMVNNSPMLKSMNKPLMFGLGGP